MKRQILGLILPALAILGSNSAQSQCAVITCPSDIVVNNDAGTCGAVVSYTAPVGTDPCMGSATYTFTGAPETFTVPPGITSITITASGGQGAGGGAAGGLGATMIGTFTVTPGQVLDIIVGGIGLFESPGNSGSGGGGSGVIDAGTPLIIAGAGGGGAINEVGQPGLTTTSGGNSSGAGGTAGSGGQKGYWAGDCGWAAGGGGFLGDGYGGDSGWDGGPLPGSLGIYGGGKSHANGGAGGTDGGCSFAYPNFGIYGCGGGGSGSHGGGGGGGYSGGGGGQYNFGGGSMMSGGGGGGSFNSGTAQINTAGDHAGAGEITIDYSAGLATTSLITGLGDGATFPVGTTTETYEVVGGSSATCSFDITVIDAEDPTVICPGDTTVCDTIMSGLLPIVSDNCPGEALTYTLTGATLGTGPGDANGVDFNTGITLVNYLVTDAEGNTTNCTFQVEVFAGPNVAIDLFDPDTVCSGGALITVPAATPPGGTYSGTGVSGTDFDPSTPGTFTVTYTFTDTDGCTNDAGTDITVLDCSAIEENEVDGVTILPNPSNGIFNIVYDNHALDKVSIVIRDMSGKIVHKSNSDQADVNEQININAANGIYLLEFKAGDKTNQYKLIKQ